MTNPFPVEPPQESSAPGSAGADTGASHPRRRNAAATAALREVSSDDYLRCTRAFDKAAVGSWRRTARNSRPPEILTAAVSAPVDAGPAGPREPTRERAMPQQKGSTPASSQNVNPI